MQGIVIANILDIREISDICEKREQQANHRLESRWCNEDKALERIKQLSRRRMEERRDREDREDEVNREKRMDLEGGKENEEDIEIGNNEL